MAKQKHGYASSKDGKRLTPTYRTWQTMIQRCHNPNHTTYGVYGGRGIIVCERWRGVDGFIRFLADMGERPEGTSLDRINGDGNYTHLNCRWATREEQGWNRRTNKLERYEVDQIVWLRSLGYKQREVAAFFGISRRHVGDLTERYAA